MPARPHDPGSPFASQALCTTALQTSWFWAAGTLLLRPGWEALVTLQSAPGSANALHSIFPISWDMCGTHARLALPAQHHPPISHLFHAHHRASTFILG